VSGYDDFLERLEAALADEEAREDFLEYLQELTSEGRAEILAEADRREAGAEGAPARGDEVSASGKTKKEAEREPKDEAERPDGQPSDGVHEVPLFLRGRSDGRKGNAQDEKDEAGE